MRFKFSISRNTRLIGFGLIAILTLCYFILFVCELVTSGYIQFELFGDMTWWIFQTLILISLIIINLSFKVHKSFLILIFGFASAAMIFHAYHFEHGTNWHIEMAMGMFGFTVVTILNFYKGKRCK